MAKAAMKHLKESGAIINTSSGHNSQRQSEAAGLLGDERAIVTFTRSLSQALAKTGIRVNGVRSQSNLDTAYSVVVSRRRCRDVRLRRAAWASRSARGNCAQLRIPRLGWILVHDGADSTSERRDGCKRVIDLVTRRSASTAICDRGKSS